MSVPGVTRYQRMPTRLKLQFCWGTLLLVGFVYHFVSLTVMRVTPKREEQVYAKLHAMYGDHLPDKLLDVSRRQREALDTLTLSNMLRTPTPGQTSNALQNELNPYALAQHTSWNGR